MGYNYAGERTTRSIFIPPEYHNYAKDSMVGISHFIQTAIVFYCEKLREQQLIKSQAFTKTIAWNKWF